MSEAPPSAPERLQDAQGFPSNYRTQAESPWQHGAVQQVQRVIQTRLAVVGALVQGALFPASSTVSASFLNVDIQRIKVLTAHPPTNDKGVTLTEAMMPPRHRNKKVVVVVDVPTALSCRANRSEDATTNTDAKTSCNAH